MSSTPATRRMGAILMNGLNQAARQLAAELAPQRTENTMSSNPQWIDIGAKPHAHQIDQLTEQVKRVADALEDIRDRMPAPQAPAVATCHACEQPLTGKPGSLCAYPSNHTA